MLISRLSNRKPVLLFLSVVAIFNNVESVLCGVLFNRYHNTHDDELRKLLKQNWNSLLIGECAFSSSRLNLVFFTRIFLDLSKPVRFDISRPNTFDRIWLFFWTIFTIVLQNFFQKGLPSKFLVKIAFIYRILPIDIVVILNYTRAGGLDIVV
jgi:hypothetical protein